jgi:hypothetical protein
VVADAAQRVRCHEEKAMTGVWEKRKLLRAVNG